MGRTADGISLVSHAIQAVRDHISVHALRAGDPLPGEAYFAQTGAVSRAVIREAFGALAALKLIDVANGRRARVGAMDGAVLALCLDHAVTTGQATIAHVGDLYRALALQAAELAASERTDAEAADLLALARASSANGLALQAAVASATHNRLFVQMMRAFAPSAAGSAGRAADRLALAQAIADRDASAARAQMNACLDPSGLGQDAGGVRRSATA